MNALRQPLMENNMEEEKQPASPSTPSPDSSLLLGTRYSLNAGVCGLSNQGNTCYFNSCVQALSNIAPLTQFFCETHFPPRFNEKRSSNLSRSFRDVIVRMWSGRHESFAPSSLLSDLARVNRQFAGFEQHDSQEALRFLLSEMHETLAFDEVEREQPKTSDPKYQRAKRKTPKKGRKKKSHAEEEKKEEVSTGVDKDGIPEPLDEAASDQHASAQHAEVKNAIVPHKSLSSAVYSVKEVSPAGMGYAQGPALLSPVLEGKQMLGSDGLPEWVHRGPYTGIRKQLRSVVSDMFEGKLRSTVRCRSCGYKSPKDDTFWDLSLPIPKRSVAAAAATDDPRKKRKKVSWCSIGRLITGKVTLEDCLSEFCTSEELTGNNKYYCEKCKQERNADRSICISELPEVLCLHLKRFRHMHFGSKIGRNVAFPTKGLRMDPYVTPDMRSQIAMGQHKGPLPIYDLVSVVRHIGGLGGGHYVAYAKNWVTQQWYKYNDSYVTQTSASKVANVQGYVLFYQRRRPSNTPPSLPGVPLLRLPDVKNEGHTVTTQSSAVAMNGHSKDAVGPKKASDSGTSGDHVFVSHYWWLKFRTTSDPGPCKMDDVACEHGRVKASLAKDIQRLVVPLPREAWEVLVERYGGYCLDNLDRCPRCKEEAAVLAERRRQERAEVMKIDTDEVKEDVWNIISESWLKRWRNFINDEGRTDGTGRGVLPPPPIDNSILLRPDGVTPAKNLVVGRQYRGVNSKVWNFLTVIYGGGPRICRKELNIYSAVVEAPPLPRTLTTNLRHLRASFSITRGSNEEVLEDTDADEDLPLSPICGAPSAETPAATPQSTSTSHHQHQQEQEEEKEEEGDAVPGSAKKYVAPGPASDANGHTEESLSITAKHTSTGDNDTFHTPQSGGTPGTYRSPSPVVTL